MSTYMNVQVPNVAIFERGIEEENHVVFFVQARCCPCIRAPCADTPQVNLLHGSYPSLPIIIEARDT